MNKISGIYIIRNKNNGKQYIGSSCNVKHRLQVHRTYLRGDYHDNIYLQRSWNKHGETAFEFVLLFQCAQSKLISKEIETIASYKSNQRQFGFNIGECVVSPRKGRPHSDETKEKIKEHWRTRGHPCIGRKMSDETKKAIASSLRLFKSKNKLVFSPDVKKALSERQIGEKNHMFGKTGAKNRRSQKIQKLSANGEVIATYDSMRIAASENHISQGNLSMCCSGRLKSLGGFLWRRLDIPNRNVG